MPDRRNDGEDDLARALAALAGKAGRAARRALKRQESGGDLRIPDPKVVGDAFVKLAGALLADPERLALAQTRLWERMAELWRRQLRRAEGRAEPPLAEPEPGDRRFRDRAWSEDPVFDGVKQSYLVLSRWLQATVAEADGLDPATKRKAVFYTRQLVDALSPSNFALTNPAVLRRAAETDGASLRAGLGRLIDDLERGGGGGGRDPPRAPSAGGSAFRVGRDVAVTPGKIVLRNELMELLQYAPTTERVFERPLLVVPPWINKYYVLDLRPANSFVRYAVGQGFTVFVISWVNPGPALAGKTFESYLDEGPLAALDAIGRATGARDASVLGYCLGGTLAACLLGWMAATGDDRVKAASFLATLTDFAEPGELAVFIDDEQLALVEKHMEAKGYLAARHMRTVFSLLRANDLIWSSAVDSYLMGREPAAFDLLRWSADGTRMPRTMHSFYLRNMYQRNLLARPGGIALKGVPIDLRAVRTPSYFLSTREDHIAPWASTYRGSRLFSGPVRFVLGGSGHVAGVVNPPDPARYGYRTNAGRRPAEPEAWLAGARGHEGSWWPDWRAWLARRSGPLVPARVPGAGGLTALGEAPGGYVRARAVD